LDFTKRNTLMQLDELWAAQKSAVLKGDKKSAADLAAKALEMDADLLECIERGFGAGIREVGDLWEAGDYFLPELVQGAEAMKAGMAVMAVIQPALKARQQDRKLEGTVVIGTLAGDIHDIGKTLVATFLEANGFKVFDLGKDVPIEKFIDTAERESADLLCLSALLTTTMTGQARLIETLQEKGLRDRFAVMIGGAPVSADYAAKIGADAYGANAVDALNEALRLMERS
jgi:trimethylamine corrinoid protein